MVQGAGLPGRGCHRGEHETQWVDPSAFFGQLPEVMAEIPPRPGEEAWYEWLGSVLYAADEDAQVAAVRYASWTCSGRRAGGPKFSQRIHRVERGAVTLAQFDRIRPVPQVGA